MSLIKKCDVKAHFASRKRKGVHPVHQADKPALTGLPETGVVIEAKGPAFVADFSLEHSSPGGAVTAAMIIAASDTRVSNPRGDQDS
jgi:hypothetical protein